MAYRGQGQKVQKVMVQPIVSFYQYCVVMLACYFALACVWFAVAKLAG